MEQVELTSEKTFFMKKIMRCLRGIELLNLWLAFYLAYSIPASLQQNLESSIFINANYQNPLHSKCDIYKVTFKHNNGQEYIQYKSEFPEMEEFTLCAWTKLGNHDRNHPLFSYAVNWQKCEICSWVINTKESSYLSLTVAGHTLFRLNYPLKLRKWYHICESWNGKTGEWQVWVNAERVGRGFYNRLVGYKIPAEGVAITGQDHKWKDRSSYESDDLYKEDSKAPDGGMVGEITMVQLYKVALTAGKAHSNHKHHHAHKYDHHGNEISSTSQTKTSKKSAQKNGGPYSTPDEQLGLASYRLRSSFATALDDPLLSDGADVFYSRAGRKVGIYRLRSNPRLLKRQATEGLHKHRKRETFLIAGGTIMEDGLGSIGGTLHEASFLSDNSDAYSTEDKKSSDKEPAEDEVKSIMNVCSGCDEEPFEKALVMGWRNTSKIISPEADYVRAINRCPAF